MRKIFGRKTDHRRKRAGLLVLTGALCLSFVGWHTGRVQAQAQGTEIVLTPSAPVHDNGIAGVYGYYNGDDVISVEIFVKTEEDGSGIRQISYQITDGTESPDKEISEWILYEDSYVEEPGETEEPGKENESEETKEKQEKEEPKGKNTEEEAEKENGEEAPGKESDGQDNPDDTGGAKDEDDEDDSGSADDEGESDDEENPDGADDEGNSDDEEDPDGTDDEGNPDDEGDPDDEENPDGTDEEGEPDDEEDSDSPDEEGDPDDEEDPDNEENPDDEDDEDESDDLGNSDDEEEDSDDRGDSGSGNDEDESDNRDASDEPEEPGKSSETDETEKSELPGMSEKTEITEEVGETDITEEAEVEKESSLQKKKKEEHQALHSWTGSVVVYPEKWHTGDVVVRVKVTDFSGEEKEASVRLDIDIDAPELSITGVEDGCSYRNAVAPTVEIEDRTFSSYTLTLSRTRLDEIDQDVTDLFVAAQEIDGQGGTISCKSPARTRENDGIYTLRVSAEDGAGNESEAEATFSVNRFGSVYVFGDYLTSLLQNGGIYTREITEDLVITEYNADRLLEDSLFLDITRDGKPVTNVLCRTSPNLTDTATVGSRGWYEYRYVISKENFVQDGVYKVSVSSKDAAGNTPDNAEATGREILFRVDATAPEVTGSAKTDANGKLEEGENFSYSVYDTIGLLSLEIFSDGEEEPEEITDFGTNVNYYEGTLALPHSLKEQEVRMVATDLAGNVTEESFLVPAGARSFLQRSFSSPTDVLEQVVQNGRLWLYVLGVAVGAAAFTICLLLYGRRKRSGL